jgi:hypothetical protein
MEKNRDKIIRIIYSERLAVKQKEGALFFLPLQRVSGTRNSTFIISFFL